MDPLLHSVAAAADRLGLTLPNMEVLIKGGQIRSLRRGFTVLVPETELVRYVTEAIDNIEIAPATIPVGQPITDGRYAGSSMAREVPQMPEPTT